MFHKRICDIYNGVIITNLITNKCSIWSGIISDYDFAKCKDYISLMGYFFMLSVGYYLGRVISKCWRLYQLRWRNMLSYMTQFDIECCWEIQLQDS